MTSASNTAPSGYATAFAALCAGAVAMGLSPVFVRVSGGDVGPFASAFWRVALAIPLLYAWMRFEEARAPAGPRRRFGAASLLSGLAFSGDLLFWHLAIFNTTVANATFFCSTAPFFVVLLTWLVLRKPISRATLLGLALCMAGGAAIIGQSLQVDPSRLRGDLFGLATAVFFGLYFLTVARARETAGAARVTFESSLVTAAILLMVALAFEPHILPRTWQGSAALLAMAWVSHAGGQGLLVFALGRLPAVFSSLVIFLEAVAAAAFGWMLLAEPVSSVQAAGGALILVGIWIARPRREPRSEGVPIHAT
jgi:drug/metabolite transporter (DMT)-like permease